MEQQGALSQHNQMFHTELHSFTLREDKHSLPGQSCQVITPLCVCD